MHRLLISVCLSLVIAIHAAREVDPICEEPPEIKYASVTDISDDTYRIGTVVTYTCQFGYLASGKSRTLSCERSRRSAEWTQPQFSCIPQSCGDPGMVTNAHRVGSLFTFPNSVTYTCDTGYTLRGIATRYCQTSGTWSGRLPTCNVVNCDPLDNPENGHVTAVSLEYGSELVYKCDKGFSLSTDEIVYCTEEGKWSRNDVTCNEIVCKIPERPEYGYVNFHGTEERPRAGSIAIFSCEGDRVAYGPTTSKCLDIGKWTFPPPKCLEPCSVQGISNGVIGKYVRERYGRKAFKEIRLGTRVKDNEELYLRCSNGYEAAGSKNSETEISCNKGIWSVYPHCEPASCRSKAPSAANAVIDEINPVHGGTVSYLCSSDYKKVTIESVICNLGEWIGDPPTCKSTKCSADDLKNPGLLRGVKSSYRDGEVMKINCASRYQLAEGFDGDIRCEEGAWRISFPPCVATNCSSLPPEIEHGIVRNPSLIHGSIAKYDCEYPYIPVGGSIVQCVFGNWEGQIPKCQDSRCSFWNLKNLEHISLESPNFTYSGSAFNVICSEGYTAKWKLPICQDGVWKGEEGSLCKESDCNIPRISSGSLREETYGSWYFSLSKFRFEREVNYNIVQVGSISPSGDVLWLFCNEPFSVHGSRNQRELIQCSKGKWSTDPVCLRYGEVYVPPTTAASRTTVSPAVEVFLDGMATTAKPVLSSITPSTRTAEWTPQTYIDEDTPKVTKGTEYSTEPPVEECFCEYPIRDSNIVAHANGKRLKYGDRVRNGSAAIFRCLHVGYHRFRGHQEILCDDCQPWHSSNFPSCTEPQTGNTVIVLDKNVHVTMQGNLEIEKGRNVNFTCIAMETARYPEWRIPTLDGISYTRERIEREEYGDILYITDLHLKNADYENEGNYECYIKDSPTTKLDVVVIDPNLQCPELTEDDGIIIKYENERRESNKVSFSCPKEGQELIGQAVLTCLRSGEWSDLPPYCTGIKCKELKGTELLKIQYTDDREVGSTAAFHCFVPGKRYGVSHTKCLENGSWADPTPTCRTAPCSVEDLLSDVPHHVELVTDSVNNASLPYNSTVKLICDGDMITVGFPVAKCGREGKWILENVECSSGCQPPENPPGSKLKLSPEKEIYKFGESLTFSCPPGMHLNTESQVIMCLTNGWTDTSLPKCDGNENLDYLDYKEESDQAGLDYKS